MEYKRALPVLSENRSSDSEALLGYIEDIKEETAVRITTLERAFELIKENLEKLLEVNQ